MRKDLSAGRKAGAQRLHVVNQSKLAEACRPVVEQLEDRCLLMAVVTTDQPDYAPGSTAHFIAGSDGGPGRNFQVGESVQFQVTRTDGAEDFPPANQPWTIIDGGEGDADGVANGEVSTSWYVDPQYAGASLELTATGQDSGAIAQAAFTDGSATAATGGSAISADTNTTNGSATWTSLTGPVYTETAVANVGTGTIILNAPTGFVFDTGGTAPTVLITRLAGSGANTNNINAVASGTSAAITSRTSTAITFTVTSVSANSCTNSLTWQNIRVRPSAGTPLATTGNITKSSTSTSTMNGVTNGTTNFGTLTEVAGVATKLGFGQQPTAAAAGASITPAITVLVQDQYGNTKTTDTSTVALAIGTNPSGGTLSGTASHAAVAGIATFSGLSIDLPGTGYTLAATDGALTGATSSAFNITTPAPTLTSIDTTSGNRLQTLNVGFVGTNFVSGSTTVSFGSNISVNSVTVASSTSLTANITIAAAAATGARDVSVTNPGGGTATLTGAFSVNNPTPSLFSLTVTSGIRQQTLDVPLVGANFISGVTTASFGTNIAVNSVTVADSTHLTANITIAAAATTGLRSVSVTNAEPGGGASALGNAFRVNAAGVVSRLAFGQQPTATAPGAVITPAITVLVQDQAGNTVTTDTSAVTLAIGTNPSGGTLSGTKTVNAVAGVATFSGLSIDFAGAGYTLTASDGALTGTTSSAFNISTPVPTLTSIGTTSGSRLQTMDVAFVGANFVSGLTTVSLGASITVNSVTVTDSAHLTANITIASAAATGARDVSVTNPGGGTATLTGAFTVNPAAVSSVAFVQAPAAGTAGAAISPAVTVRLSDALGGVVGGATATMSVATGPGSLTGTISATSDASGIATFGNLILNTSGSYTLTVTSNGNTATSGAFAVAPAAAATFAVSGFPTSITAGTAGSITVTAKDAQGNIATGYTGTVHFTSNDAQAVLPANYTFLSGDNGVHTFTNGVTLKTAGSANRSITATDTVTGTLTASQSGITVIAAAASVLSVSAPATATVGTAFSVTVTALDSFGNTATGYTGTVHFTSDDGLASLPASYTFVSGDSGVHTFTNAATLNSAGSKSVVATDTVTGTITGSDSVTVSTVLGTTITSLVDLGSYNATTWPGFSGTASPGTGTITSVAVSIWSGTLSKYWNGTGFTSASEVFFTATMNPITPGAGDSVTWSLAFPGTNFVTGTQYQTRSRVIATSGTAYSHTGSTWLRFTVDPAAPVVTLTSPANSTFTTSTTPAISGVGGVLTGDGTSVTVKLYQGSDTNGTLLQTLTDSSLTAGAYSVTPTTLAAGTYTAIASQSDSAGNIGQSAPVTFAVYSPVATSLLFGQQPTAAAAGASITPAVTVLVKDQYGSTLTTDTSAVTLAIGTNPGSGTLSGTKTVNAVAGVATFSGLSINLGGTGYTLVASDGSLTGVTSSAFTISNPVPTLTSLGTTSGSRLQTLNVAFVGTNFVNGATTVSFGSNITVNSVTVNSSTSLTANITIDVAAATGARNVTVTNPAPGGGTATLTSAFTVNNPVPTATSIGTTSGIRQQTLDVAFVGTNFISGVTTVSFGTNITVNSVTVADSSHLTANITIATAAATGARNVTVTNPTPGGGTATLTSAFTVNASGVATQLAFSQQPTAATVGASITPAITVLVQDQYGNTVVTDTSAVTLAIGNNPSSGTLSGTKTVNAAAGIATFSGLSLNIAGTGYTLVASDGTLTGVTSSAFNISNPVPTLTSLGTTSGGRLQTLNVAFVGSNFVSGLTTVSFGSSITVNSVTVNSSTSLTANITIDVAAATGARNVTVTNPAPGGGTATLTSAFTVNNPVPTATSIGTISGIRQQTLDVAFVGTSFISGVTTVSFGTNITVNSVTVADASHLTANITIAAAAATGARNVTVTNATPGGGTATLTNGFTVNAAGIATQLAFSQQPTATAPGASITPAITVLVQDQYGNTVTTDTSTVTLAIGNNPSGGTLSGTAARAAVAGVATFSGLSIDNLGTGYTLTASDDSLTGAASSAFDITYPVPTLTSLGTTSGSRLQTLNVAFVGTNFVSGATTVSFGANITVNSVTVNSSTSLTANITIDVAAATGARSVTVTNPAPGGGTATLTNGFTVNNPVPTATSIGTISGIRQQTLDVAFVGTNFVNGATTVSFGTNITVNSVTVADSSHLTANITIAAAAATGARNVTVTNPTPGGGTATLTNGFAVNASAVASQLVFDQQPTSAVAGSAITPAITVLVQDQYGNTVTTDTSAVALAIGNNPGGGTLSGTKTVNAVAGVATFSGLSIDLVGAAYTLVASDGALTGDTSSPFSVSLVPISIGTNVVDSGAHTSLTLHPSVAVPVGSTIILAFTWHDNKSSGTFSASDGANTYHLDADADVDTGTTIDGLATEIFSATVTTALTTSSTITLTFPSTDKHALSAFMVSGLVASTPYDRTSTAFLNAGSVSPNSGATATTSQANELLFGAIGTQAFNSTFTPGSGYTALTTAQSGTGGKSAAILPEYQWVSATGQYAATGTLGVSKPWAAAIVTYKQISAASTTTTVTRTSGSGTATYGTSLTFQATVSPTVPNGETVTFRSDGNTIGTATTTSGVATLTVSSLPYSATAHVITAAYGGDANFLTSTGTLSGGQTINAAPLSITASNQSKTYGQTLVLGSSAFTAIGLQNGETVGSVTLTSSGAGSAAAAGSYPITPSAATGGTFSAGNYTIAYNTGTLTVNAATASVTLGSLSPTYDGTAKSATATTDATGASTFSFTYDGSSTAPTNAGSYAVVATLINDNYQGSAGGTLVIGKAPLTVTTNAKGKTYGDDNPTLDGSVGGVVAGDGITANFSTEAGQFSNVGGYSITATLSDPNHKLSNYNVANPGNTLTISARSVTVTPTAGQSKLYGALDPTFTYSGTLLGSDSFSGALERVAGESVAGGPYAFTLGTLSAGSNYSLSLAAQTFAITAAPTTTTVAPSANPTAYGQSVTFTAAVPNDATGTVQFKDGSSNLGSPVSVSNGSAALTLSSLTPGSHSITATYGGDGNYNASTSSAVSQVVNQSSTTTSLTRHAGTAASTTYGDSLTFDVSVSGSTPGGTVTLRDGGPSGTVIGTGTLSGGSCTITLALNALSAGTHANIVAVYEGDTNNAQSVSDALTTQTVSQKSLTAALTGTVSKTYDGTQTATLAAENYILSGAVTGDTVDLNDPTSGTYDTRNVGTGKTVTVTGLSISGSSAGNYALASTSASGDIGTISVRAITVTATANTKTYDGSNLATATPSLTFGSLASGDTTNFSETYDNQNVGTGKTLTPTGTVEDGNSGNNYAVTFASSTGGVITAADTSASVSSSALASALGAPVTFTATVSAIAPGAGTPTGTVEFFRGTTSLGLGTYSGGVWTLTTSGLPAGSSSIRAVYTCGDGNFNGASSSSITQKVLTAPQVSGAIKVNNGKAQRSMVTSLTVTFDQAIRFDSGAFVLIPINANGTPAGSAIAVTAALSADHTVVTLAWGGGTLANGIYKVSIDRAKVYGDNELGLNLADLAGNSLKFHRLLGDADGDGDVDMMDLALITKAYGNAPAGSDNAAFDFDGNGVVDQTDLLTARNYYGKKYVY